MSASGNATRFERLPHPAYPVGMMLRILAAWIAMLFAPQSKAKS
jgi:hypothetical protein